MQQEIRGDIARKIGISSNAHCGKTHYYNRNGHCNAGEHYFFTHFSVLGDVEKLVIQFSHTIILLSEICCWVVSLEFGLPLL